MLIKYARNLTTLPRPSHLVIEILTQDPANRVRTLTGKEIELDIEADYKVRIHPPSSSPIFPFLPLRPAHPPETPKHRHTSSSMRGEKSGGNGSFQKPDMK